VDSAVAASVEAVASRHGKGLPLHFKMFKNLNCSNALRFFYFFASSFSVGSFGLLNRT